MIYFTAAFFLHLVVFLKVNDGKEFDYFVGWHLVLPSTFSFLYLIKKKKSKHSKIPYAWPGTVPVKTPPTQQTRFLQYVPEARACEFGENIVGRTLRD